MTDIIHIHAQIPAFDTYLSARSRKATGGTPPCGRGPPMGACSAGAHMRPGAARPVRAGVRMRAHAAGGCVHMHHPFGARRQPKSNPFG